MTTRSRILIALSIVTGSLGGASPARACSASTIPVMLTDFAADAPGHTLYWAAEGSGGTFRVERGGDVCSEEYVSVSYSTVSGTATAPADFTNVGGTVQLYDAMHGPAGSQSYVDVSVSMTNDQVAEPLEAFEARLSDPQGAYLGDPSHAPFYVVDDDALVPTFSFADAAYERPEGPLFRLPVFRGGPATSGAGVEYAINPVAPASAQDYSEAESTGTISFAPGQRLTTLDIVLTDDSLIEGDEQLEVALSGATAGISRTTIVIKDTDQGIVRPKSKVHHPKHGNTYGPDKDSYSISKEVHILTSASGWDEPTFEVAGAELALRKNKKNGTCAWWSGTDFVRGGCRTKLWVKEGVSPLVSDVYYYKYPKGLRSSVGTRIRDYTVFSRAIDEMGNAEIKFKVGRNANTFEVIKPS